MINAKEYLISIRKSEARLDMKTQRLHSLRERLTSITVATDKEVVSHTKNVDVMGETIATIADLETDIDCQMKAMIKAKAEAEKLLDQIDPTSSKVLTERFIEGKTLNEVGKSVFLTQRHVQRKIKEALAEFQALLDEKGIQSTPI